MWPGRAPSISNGLSGSNRGEVGTPVSIEPGFDLILDNEYSLETGVGIDDKLDSDRRREATVIGAAGDSRVPGVRKMVVYSGPG